MLWPFMILKCFAGSHSPTSSSFSSLQFSPSLYCSCFWTMRHINHFLECSHSQGRSELLWSEWVLTHFLCLAGVVCWVGELKWLEPCHSTGKRIRKTKTQREYKSASQSVDVYSIFAPGFDFMRAYLLSNHTTHILSSIFCQILHLN